MNNNSHSHSACKEILAQNIAFSRRGEISHYDKKLCKCSYCVTTARPEQSPCPICPKTSQSFFCELKLSLRVAERPSALRNVRQSGAVLFVTVPINSHLKGRRRTALFAYRAGTDE